MNKTIENLRENLSFFKILEKTKPTLPNKKLEKLDKMTDVLSVVILCSPALLLYTSFLPFMLFACCVACTLYIGENFLAEEKTKFLKDSNAVLHEQLEPLLENKTFHKKYFDYLTLMHEAYPNRITKENIENLKIKVLNYTTNKNIADIVESMKKIEEVYGRIKQEIQVLEYEKIIGAESNAVNSTNFFKKQL